MSRIAVISPHPDDAVFGVAEHMLSRPDDEFTIVVPCGAIPAREPDTSKYVTILKEHEQVTTRTGWISHLGPFVDHGVVERGHENGDLTCADLGDLVYWLARQLQATNENAFRDKFDEWWVPVGIHHPDHVMTSRAAMSLGRPTACVCLYEELPYRVLYPLRQSMDLSYGLTGFGPLGPQLEAKRRLCNLYASQMGETEERCLWAPERLWSPT